MVYIYPETVPYLDCTIDVSWPLEGVRTFLSRINISSYCSSHYSVYETTSHNYDMEFSVMRVNIRNYLLKSIRKQLAVILKYGSFLR